jgi:hypothetical protein
MSTEELQELADECARIARKSIESAGFGMVQNNYVVIAAGQIASTLLEYRLRKEHS